MELLAMETILTGSLIGYYGDRMYVYRYGINPGVPPLTFLGRNKGTEILPGTVVKAEQNFAGSFKLRVIDYI